MTPGQLAAHPSFTERARMGTDTREHEMADLVDSQSPGVTGQGGGNGLLIGVGVAALAFAAVMVPSAGFSVADDLPVDTMVAKLSDARASLMVGGALQALAAIVVYGAFVRRALLRREPEHALTPTIAWGGSLLTAAMAAMAAAHTQLAGAMEEGVDAPILLTLHTLEENLYAGAFCSLALVAGAVAVAALRRGVLPRWLGGVSAFVAVLLLIGQVVVPWAAWFPAVVWMAVSAVALRNAAR
jgi:hypothetical protein